MLDKYFAREIAGLLWRDARSSKGEVGAIDGDPLFNAQDMEIKNFVVHEGIVRAASAEVPVSFTNFGEKHQIVFKLLMEKAGWKISDITYDDGTSLLKILKGDGNSTGEDQTLKIYLVAVGDDGKAGKKIGCGDSLVPLTVKTKKTASPLADAVRELLVAPQHSAGSPKVENSWKGRDLKAESVSIRNHTATIHITGEVFVAGVCDEPRITSQIEATARQFPTVKRVRVFIGNQTLADAIR